MRLKSVFIKEYKNLQDFSITFDTDSFIDVFVGKNGSGKSNFFEALIDIFKFLYELDLADPIKFNFELVYEIDGVETRICWEEGSLTINGDEDRKSLGQTKVPDNVIIYYSGHNDKVANLVAYYEQKFKPRIKKADNTESRKFIGIDKTYKQLMMAIMLLRGNLGLPNTYIKQKLNIKATRNELRIVLKRPYFNEKISIDLGDPETAYWGAKGITKEFLDRLSTCLVSEGRIKPDAGYQKESDQYIFYVDITKLRKEFNEESTYDIFQHLDNLKTVEMLETITIEVQLNNGVWISSDQFSDGQFQSIYIYCLVELFKGRNCIMLLDEPDSYLHPEWQYAFLLQVNELTSTEKDSHILLCSHSAVTLMRHTVNKVGLFKLHNDKPRCFNVNKSYAIGQLSANMIQYSEQEQILSVINRIRIENKPVLFTEGQSDVSIIEIAWAKLFSEPIPFIPVQMFDCGNVRRCLLEEKIKNELAGKCMFGLFDFDEAYNDWNYLKSKPGTQEIESDPYNGLCVFLPQWNSYAFILPIPRIPEIESLVIKDNGTKETWGGESRVGIEHLFYNDTETKNLFSLEDKPGGGRILVFPKGSKTRFADEIVPSIDKTHFDVFRPMFDLIRSKC